MICFLLFSKARNPGEHSIVAFVLVHFWSDHALGAKICWCSHFLFLQKALKFHDENLQFAQKYVFRLFCEDPDFIKDILKETWCSPDLQKILSRQWSANDKKWKLEQKREKILKVSSKKKKRKRYKQIWYFFSMIRIQSDLIKNGCSLKMADLTKEGLKKSESVCDRILAPKYWRT